MTRNEIKAVLDRVRTWPPERQADAAAVLTLMEENHSSYQLTAEQLAEVRRRRANPRPERIPFEDVFRRLHTPSV
jgi:hypothetical protein